MNQESKNEELKTALPTLAPFPYHFELKKHFKNRKKTWDWFATNDNKTKQVESFKTSLLKNTYRLDVNSHKNLYDLVDEICDKLNLNATVTLYQEHNSLQMNAGISVIEDEAHIVFSGSIISLLAEDEMKALLAHELCHYLFYKIENEEFEITQRIVLAMANNQSSENAMIETARIFQLYLELFCDQGALKVCGNYEPVIQMLVKLNTSLKEVNAASYLTQAKEIINTDEKATERETHPESYIRSLALYYALEQPKTFVDDIKKLIEGNLDLNNLDIFSQKEMLNHTIDCIHFITKPNWMQTGKVQNLAKQYLRDNKNAKHPTAEEFTKIIDASSISVKNYFCYLLLDFAKVDSDMEGVALGHSFELSEIFGLKEEFEKIVKKEFKLSARDFKSLQIKVTEEVAQMNESKDESLYTN